MGSLLIGCKWPNVVASYMSHLRCSNANSQLWWYGHVDHPSGQQFRHLDSLHDKTCQTVSALNTDTNDPVCWKLCPSTLLETNMSIHVPYQGTFEDDFHFHQVGYVSSLEGTFWWLKVKSFWNVWHCDEMSTLDQGFAMNICFKWDVHTCTA